MDGKVNTIDIWISVNKNGFINMSLDEPQRNDSIKKWIYHKPFINICVYKEVTNLVEHSKLNWEHEPEFLTIQVEQQA